MIVFQNLAGRLRGALLAGLIGLGLALPGCATVPPEAPELSYTVGQDMQVLQESYRKLIRAYFDALRQQVNQAIDNIYVPAFISNFVEGGKLVQHAQDNRTDLVEFWAREAVGKIDAQRAKRLVPLNKAEAELMNDVDTAFERAIHANAIVTAHLNSVREVQEEQSKILEALGVEELRQKINNTLAKVSDETAEINEDIAKVSKALTGAE